MPDRASNAAAETSSGRGPDGTTAPPAARLLRVPVRSSAVRIWLFVGLLSAVAVPGFVLIVAPLPPLASPFHLAWPLLAVGFFAAEATAMAVHFRRETHSFSLSEVAVVVGLFFVSPAEYTLALLVGSGLALVIVARQSFVKVAFNLSNSALMAVVQIAVFRALAQSGSAPALDDWLATFASTLTVAGLTALTIAAAISISGGAAQTPKLPEMFKFAGVSAVANTSLGLLAVSILWNDPWELWLLIAPLGVLVVAYRAFISEREKHERLELLYQSSRILQHSPELDSAIVALLVHARDMFRAEVAELALYPRAEGAGAVRTTSLHDGRAEVMVPMPPADDPFRSRVATERSAFIGSPPDAVERGGYPLRRAIVSPLLGESGLIGSLLVANRLTEGTTFDEDERRLLETIANQTAVALENGQLEQSLAELSRLKEQLRYQAYHDPLTGLANRTMFAMRVDEQLARLDPQHVCAVLFLDLDDFKLVNDTLGHAAGDRLLGAVAGRIKGCIRGDDLAARLGGDEFALLLLDEDHLERATAVAARIIETLQAPFVVEGQDLLIGGSIGIAVGRSADEHSEDVLRNADVAMYTAKAAGKRRVAVFDPTMHAAIVARHGLSAELSRSVGRGELLVHYQPIVQLQGGAVVAAEALVRWNHPTRGYVPPDDFIPLAEENGAILALGHWVLSEACSQAAAWIHQAEIGDDFAISVNLSPLQLQQDEFVAEVAAILGATGLPPNRLILEITETAMFQDAQATTVKLQALRARGVRIAVDDFGTGYSSLSYLRRFPVDILKVARDFIVPADRDPSEWAFAHAILALGATLGLEVVAEGIEEPGQVERLRELGCALGQGYYLGRPAPGSAFVAELRRAGREVAPPAA